MWRLFVLTKALDRHGMVDPSTFVKLQYIDVWLGQSDGAELHVIQFLYPLMIATWTRVRLVQLYLHHHHGDERNHKICG